MRKLYDLGVCFSIVSIALVSGCGAAEPAEQVEESTAAISGDFTDSSGKVLVRIKQCAWSSISNHPRSQCSVDSDFVLIGGGAEIEGRTNPGAMLTESYPNADLTTWTAASKDQQYSNPHRVRPFAIGLKLIGNDGQPISVSDLKKYMYFQPMNSGSSEHPSINAELPGGYLLLGGGAKANWASSGLLLVASHPDSFQWYAEAKDHIYAELGSVDAFAIGISAGYIPNFGYLTTYTSSNSTWVSSNYATTTYALQSGYALASIGGYAQYNNPRAGRMLTQLIPFYDALYTRPGATVTSKDHRFGDSGETLAYVTGIKKQ